MTRETDVLIELRNKVAELLCQAALLPEPLATKCSNSVIDLLRQHCGGERLYISKTDRAAVRAAVVAEFNGRNRDEVCAKHQISVATFYNYIGAARGKNG